MLYRAVIKQAAKDAFLLNSQRKYILKERDRALEFLKGGKDLEFACDVAKVSYQAIVRQMENLSSNNNENYKRIILEINKKI